MTFFGTKDFFVEVALGNIPGYSSARVYGNNTIVDSVATEDLWAAGGNKVYLSSAETVDVVSDNAADTSAGTGARTVEITGVDGSYDELIETVTMNGVTPVTSVGSFLRVDQAEVITAGSGGTNTGTITLDPTTTGSGSRFGTILPSAATTANFFYTVRNNQEALALLFNFSVFSSPTTTGVKAGDVTVQARKSGEIFNAISKYGARSDGSSVFESILILPEVFPAQTDFKVNLNAENNNTQFTGFAEILLHDV